jgi:DnaK suppressor protein
MIKEQKKRVKLTPAEIRKFQAMLMDKRNNLLGNVTDMENDALHEQRSDLSNIPIHMADLGTDSFEQEFTLELMDSERKLIAEIDDALKRVENGTYGICEVGGEPIPKQRLNAIPWARCCINCASLLEKGLLKRQDSSNKYYYVNGIDDLDDETNLDRIEKAY